MILNVLNVAKPRPKENLLLSFYFLITSKRKGKNAVLLRDFESNGDIRIGRISILTTKFSLPEMGLFHDPECGPFCKSKVHSLWEEYFLFSQHYSSKLEMCSNKKSAQSADF